MTAEKKKPEGLELMREPFEAHQISKLPKPTKAQTDEVKSNFKAGERCIVCGGWHHPKVVHLDYVGHAALTDRLLKADSNWNWEPFALDSNGLPAIDKDGGLWIRLTVCGITRPGYGDAQGKTGGDAMKERIGDALRNAAMRFGAALDLWHKGDLHVESEEKPATITPTTGVWDGIGEEEKQFLMDIAMEVIGHIETGDIAKAVDTLEEKKLDAEEKIALWTRFDSKQRSAMKREAESRKEQKAA